MANLQLADNLRGYRVSHDLTQDYISMKLNISRQAYSNYERGLRTPDIDLLAKLASLYNISLDQLVLVPYQHAKKKPKDYSIFCEDKKACNTTFVTATELDYILKFRQADPSLQATVTQLLNAK